jgi:hypothetical protein
MVGQDGNITAPAFTLVPLPESWVSSVPNKEDYLQFGLDQNGEGINFFDYAARCVCALRAAGYEKGTGDLDGLPYQVGGFLQMTLMLPDKLSSAIVHRWPDEIGKPVDKSAGDAMPKFPLQF